MLARYGALDVLDAVRVGQAESLNAASAALQARAVRPSACRTCGHCLAVSMPSGSQIHPTIVRSADLLGRALIACA